MKIATIVAGLLAAVMIAAAGLRLLTMTPDTEPLIDLGLPRPDAEPAPARVTAPPTAEEAAPQVDQDATVRHLQGTAWEWEEREAPTATERATSEADEWERAEQVIDQREEDFQDARDRTRGILRPR